MRLFTEIIIFVIFTSLFFQGMAFASPVVFDMPPPLKQLKVGLSSGEVKCDAFLQKIIKTSDGSPYCVKESSADRLLDNGFRNVEESDANYLGFIVQTDSLIDKLQDNNDVILGEEIEDHFPDDSKQETMILLNGEEILLQEFVYRESAILDAYGTYHLLTTDFTIDYGCNTAFFLKDYLIIVYSGTNEEIIEILQNVIGKQPFHRQPGFAHC